MAPSAIDVAPTNNPAAAAKVPVGKLNSMKNYPPMYSSGSLDKYKQVEITPCIGTQFVDLDLAELLRAPNSDQMVRDLTVITAERGVCFFRDQKNVTAELQKELCWRMHTATNMPKETGFYRHSLYSMQGEDPELGKVDQDRLNNMHGEKSPFPRQSHLKEWHTDSSFEPNAPDFTILMMQDLPVTGGDTLWASGYEMYERLTEPYKRFFESLTATHQNMGLYNYGLKDPKGMDPGPRGGPNNLGLEFKTQHPVVRTHPITGWKSLFALGTNCRSIDDVTPAESAQLMEKIMRLLTDNHDLQVRFRWESETDLAVWDNRCTFHTVTQDHFNKGKTRIGWRCMTMGEVPFLDENSKSRDEETGGWPYKRVAPSSS